MLKTKRKRSCRIKVPTLSNFNSNLNGNNSINYTSKTSLNISKKNIPINNGAFNREIDKYVKFNHRRNFSLVDKNILKHKALINQNKKCEVCNGSYESSTYILCELCEDAYHSECAGLENKPLVVVNFYCNKCRVENYVNLNPVRNGVDKGSNLNAVYIKII